MEQAGKSRFKAGDVVKVRSREQIMEGLDTLNSHEGCGIMNQMWEYCGKRFKILKVLNHFFDEYRFRMYRPRAPFYILEGLICDGEVDSFPHRCDRSCYIIWHEDWLEKN